MSLFFKNREGQTPIDQGIKSDLKISHVQTMNQLYEYESQNISLGILWTESTKKDHLDYLVWIEVHKHMLEDVWRFAGKTRIIELANSDFLNFYDIRPALLQLQNDFKFWIKEKIYSQKEMIARFHERLLTIHPFKDGNGRWARVLTEFICRREKIPIPNWGEKIEKNEIRRNKYIEAIKKARHHSDYQELIDIMFYDDR